MDISNIVYDLYECYKTFQASHPHLGSMLTAEVTFTTSDLIAQLITDRKVDIKKLGYTAALAPVYGLCVEGLIESGELVGRNISDNPLAKGALGPNLWGNFFNTFFFVNNTVGEKKGYSLRNLGKHYLGLLSPKKSEEGLMRRVWDNFKDNYISNIPGREMLYATLGTLTLWNAFQYYNFTYVDEEMRTATTLVAAFVWTPALSWLSLRGRRKIVDKLDLENRITS